MKYTKLSEICYIVSKGKNSTLEMEGNVKMLTFPAITNNGDICEADIPKSYLENPYLDLKTYNVENKDIIFSITFRNKLVIKQLNFISSIENMMYSSRVAYIRVNPEKYNPDFLFELLNTDKYIKRLEKEVYTAGIISQISLERLKNFEVPDISIEEQKKILQEKNKIDDKISNLEKQLKELFNL